MFGITDVYLAWCVDEACALAATQEQAKPKGAYTDGKTLSGTVRVVERPPDAPTLDGLYKPFVPRKFRGGVTPAAYSGGGGGDGG